MHWHRSVGNRFSHHKIAIYTPSFKGNIIVRARVISRKQPGHLSMLLLVLWPTSQGLIIPTPLSEICSWKATWNPTTLLCHSDQLRPTWTFSIVSIQRARWIIGSCSANVSWKWLKIFQLCHQNYKRRFLSLSVGKSDLTPWASNHFWATEHPVSDDWNHSWPWWFIRICIQPAFSLSRGPSLCMATRIDNWTNEAWTIIFARPSHEERKTYRATKCLKFRIY